MRIIERTTYLNKLVAVKGTPDIKVITGIRRSGKSKLLETYIGYIRKNDKKSNIVFIDFNDLSFDELKEYHKLHEYILNNYKKNKNNYLFIDEVQLCDHFELAINSIHSKELFDIYITGSNAILLSSDLATLFTGRTYQIEVYPFSYKEYCEYFELKSENIYENFNNYLMEGGFAGSYLYNNVNDKYNYINKEVIDTIIKRDLVDKYKIRNKKALNNVVDFLMDNVANPTSSNNISVEITKNDEPITNKTVSNYIGYLCNAFVYYKLNRYDLKGKTYLQTENKYYLSDTSLRYSRLGTRNLDRGRMLENIVAIELLRRGYDVYIGKLYQKEIDFVAMKWNEKVYIQVSDDISSKKTLERELRPLTQIKDSYKKMLLASTRCPQYDINGIEVIDIAEWLLR